MQVYAFRGLSLTIGKIFKSNVRMNHERIQTGKMVASKVIRKFELFFRILNKTK